MSQPDRTVFTVLREGETEIGNLTFAELRRRSLELAVGLRARVPNGDRALLLYPQGLDFIVAFFACLYAGVTAVPASLPNRRGGMDILRWIAVDSGAKWILSTAAALEPIAEMLAADSSLAVLARLDSHEIAEPCGEAEAARLSPTHVTHLQYTSGSTGLPRGVAVTHANLVANHEQVQRSFEHDASAVIVSWLPMFHDLGLGTPLMTVWAGARNILMAPGTFAQTPRRWLEVISRYRATISMAPDFAYDLCARRVGVKERAGLDLSSWRVAGNGSEPVRARTIERFVEAFGPCGFRREAFHPGYGLAEATMLVTSGSPGEPPVARSYAVSELERGHATPAAAGRPSATTLVSCGRPWPGTRLVIVDPETREEKPDRQVGEIWIQGGSVADGYWGKDAESELLFHAMTADGRGPFLRSGDLGFVDGGELFVTGRRRDLVLVADRVLYPQDIEETVATAHAALVPHGGAAFAVDAGRDAQLVVIQEVERSALRALDATEVFRSIRAAVAGRHGLQLHAIVLIKPSTLPRTTSGKVRRRASRRAFLDESLHVVGAWVAPSASSSSTEPDPQSEPWEVSARADRLIEWLRLHGPELALSHAGDESRVVPVALLGDFAKQGLLGLQVDPRHGGLGLGHADTARVLEQIAAFDFALALFVGRYGYLGVQPIAKYATPEVKALLLPGLAHGEEVAAFAFDEPGSRESSPVAHGAQGARATSAGGDDWTLFGSKYLDGVAQGASVVTVFAQTDGARGPSAFVVWDRAGGECSAQGGVAMGVPGMRREMIVLDGVRVGRAALLGAVGSGLELAEEARRHARLAIGAACVGGMKRCAQLVDRDFAVFDGKLTPNPMVLARLGAITARVAALECLVRRIVVAMDQGHSVSPEAYATCRVLGPELLLRSIDDLMQLGVSGGYAETNRISSLYRDAGLLRNVDEPPDAMAERLGAAVIADDTSVQRLFAIFHAPEAARWLSPVVEAIRQRMDKLSGALAKRSQRWGQTRAGELTTWLVLLAAVEGSMEMSRGAELERVHAWARSQFEQALGSVRLGTPSETAMLEISDVAATFAAYARAIGDFEQERSVPPRARAARASSS